ncbi:MAG: thiamine-phosphate kinase [Acidobacteriota bacterium]|nr:thiamine-phosphate kinase [Acidobacteriota bacterium]MDE3044185.1 thiamine-phosphate kinase [Acidobacteriota bacterium]
MNVPADPTNPLRELSRHEDDLLERIGKIVSERTIVRGERHVGDDAAVLRPLVGEAIVSTDVAVWGVHLDAELFSLRDLGFKAVAAAVSDLAAMGARARALVLAVVAPAGTDLEELHYGAADAAQLTGCPIVGGDLSRGAQVSVAVTVLGECPGGGAVLRSGARPGDEILVTGPLGSSAAGLRRRRAGATLNDELVLAHRRPWPRLREGMAARDAGASAMMDLSDGLGLDLHRLADASGVGFELDDVPVASGATRDEATSGGEDYELIVTTSNAARLRLLFHDRGLRAPLTIGRVVERVERRLLRNEPFERRGFEHEL